jgi:trans-aconitate methyltransferase
MLPNDDREQDRMDLLHHVFRLTLDGKLLCTPLEKVPRRVLDVGTGTGIWATEFADEFASAEVLGIDLSPIQSAWVPPNCKFYVDDAESDWSYKPEEAFDYIHARGLVGSIADWGHYYSQVYEHLTPGGWCEVQEHEGWIFSDDDTMDRGGKETKRWLHLLDEATVKFGKQLNVAARQKQWMIDAGFVDVQDDIYKVSSGSKSSNEIVVLTQASGPDRSLGQRQEA